MRINGIEVPYSEWVDDPIIRKWAGGHIDTPFIEALDTDNAPEEGTPVVGYRAFYTVNDLYYGIYKTIGQGNIKYGLMGGQEYENPQQRFTSPYPSFRPAVALRAGEPVTHSIGFFYFPDKGMAEDYFKVFAMQELEKTPMPERYRREGNVFYFPLPGEEDQGQAAPQGKYTLNMVSGIATKNEIKNDFAGFTMQEMIIHPDPIITLGQNEAFNSKK